MKEIELVGKRKDREKHFLQENGDIIAKVYKDHIHFLKNDQYQEIDNTLIQKNNHYTNQNNAYQVYFNCESTNEIMTIQTNGHQIKTNLFTNKSIKPDLIENKTKQNSKIKYFNILKNIDLEYLIGPTKVKENIILKNKHAEYQNLRFLLTTNLDLELQENKIVAKHQDQIIFTLETPYMIDANQNQNHNIKYNLTKQEKSYQLDLILDQNWLQSETTKYPVTIDPTITNNTQTHKTYNTYIFPNDTNINRYQQGIIKVGVEKVNGVEVPNRALIKFDLPTIGTGSQIIDARLYLNPYPFELKEEFKSNVINIHRITSPWQQETANWNTMNNQYDKRIEAAMSTSRSKYTQGAINVSTNNADLTHLVRKWYAKAPNYGILLKANQEVYKYVDIPIYYSNDDEVTPIILTISYRNQNGLEQYMKYLDISLKSGTSYLNYYNGNLTNIFPLGSTIQGKYPASLNLIYNTNDVILNNGEKLGPGYKLDLDQTIKEVTINENKYLEYKDADGTIHYFFQITKTITDESGRPITIKEEGFQDEDGLGLTITQNDTEYIMKSKTNHQMIFQKTNNIGYLTQIIDTNQNKIQIKHNPDQTIKEIIDANNTKITLTYETNKIIIQSPDQTTTLNYQNNQPTQIINKIGTTTIAYNKSNLVDTITHIDGLKTKYEYYNQIPNRLKKISNYGLNNTPGEYLNITYGLDTTTIIDNKNRVQTMTFTPQGNLAATSNLKSQEDVKNAYGSIENYGSEINTESGTSYQYKNKLLSYNLPNKYIKNYLTNTSFEKETIHFQKEENITLERTQEHTTTGLYSLKITNSKPNKSIYQTISIPKGNHYTFSTNIKNTTPIKLSLSYQDETNQIVETTIPSIEPNNHFQRYDISINYQETAISPLKIKLNLEEPGTAYIDDIQLEEGEVANEYNLLENSDFQNGLQDWEFTCYKVVPLEGGLIETPSTGFVEIVTLESGNKALKINMNPEYRTTLHRNFPMNGKAGDQFSISFWYKNTGFIGESGIGSTINNDVSIFFNYNDTSMGKCTLPSTPFNTNETNWQFFTYNFGAEKDYHSLDLRFDQSFNANEFYLTNINLTKNPVKINYDYDKLGNVKMYSDFDNNQSSFQYDNNNQLIKMTDPLGKNFVYEWDNKDTSRILSAIAENGVVNEIKYDENENPIRTKISKKMPPKNLPDGSYQIRAKGTDQYLRNQNKILTFNNDTNHDLWNFKKVTLQGTTNDGKPYQEIYYEINHSILTDQYLSPSNNQIILAKKDTTSTTNPSHQSYTLFSLKPNHNGSYHIKPKPIDKHLRINQDKLELAPLDPNDPSFEFYIEDNSQLFIENTSTYTKDGKYITSTTDTNFNKTIYDIDPITGLTKSITNPKNQTINYQYNTKNQITSVINKNKRVTYTYNNHNLLDTIHQNNKQYKFHYDNFLNTKKITINDQITLINNEYEPNNGNLIASTYGNNHTIKFKYDDFDRMKALEKMDDTYHYKYGNNGELVKIISNQDQIKYTYSLSKKLTDYRQNDFHITYQYNKNYDITNQNHKLNNKTYNLEHIYNLQDYTLSKTQYKTHNFNYNYDDLGRIKNKNINNIYQTNYQYITNGNRTSLLIKSIQNQDDTYSYQYDSLNNITHIYKNNQLQNKYYYDDYNELIKDDNYQTNITTKYYYNQAGNMTYKNTYQLNTNILLTQTKYEYQNPKWEDQLTSINNTKITYDEIGNPLTIGNNITLSWINGRQLTSYQDQEKTITYKYNHNSIRTSKTVNNVETKYYLEGNKIILEKRGMDVLYYIRNSIDDLIGFTYNDTIYYYIKNIQNDIIGILDSEYNVVVNYTYDAYGNILSITDQNGLGIKGNPNHIAHINPFRYRSYYYDKETNLYYLNSRYYNPEWGRFLNIDTYGGEIGGEILTYNNLIYAQNNPINNQDTEGTFAIPLVTEAIKWGIYIGGAVAGYFVAKEATKTVVPAIADALSKPFIRTPKQDLVQEAQSNTYSNTKVYAPTLAATATPAQSMQKPCTEADLTKLGIVRKARLTILESINQIDFGKDIMCDNKISAYAVSSAFPKSYHHDPHKSGIIGYYPHFHPWEGNRHPHIWYLP